jgi:hypothetical protein
MNLCINKILFLNNLFYANYQAGYDEQQHYGWAQQ